MGDCITSMDGIQKNGLDALLILACTTKPQTDILFSVLVVSCKANKKSHLQSTL